MLHGVGGLKERLNVLRTKEFRRIGAPLLRNLESIKSLGEHLKNNDRPVTGWKTGGRVSISRCHWPSLLKSKTA